MAVWRALSPAGERHAADESDEAEEADGLERVDNEGTSGRDYAMRSVSHGTLLMRSVVRTAEVLRTALAVRYLCAHIFFMSIDEHKKSRGRPTVDTEMVRSRVSREILKRMDAWIVAQAEPRPTRAQAIRLLLEAALRES
jgi:hypothetical protein